MKKIILLAALIGLSVTGYGAFADIAVQSKDEIAGTWKLDFTKNSAADKRPFKRPDSWEFKDGKLTIYNIAREGSFYDQPPEPYEVEDGKIKVMMIGSVRFDLYTLVEKDDTHMVLKGKFGTLYYFTKKE